MKEYETFLLEYPTGHMKLNVGVYFGTTDKKKTQKVLRLARQNCTDDQRLELIQKLQLEAERRTRVLDAVGRLEYQRRTLLYSVLDEDSCAAVERDLPSPEKALVRQRDKLKQLAADLQEERWAM